MSLTTQQMLSITNAGLKPRIMSVRVQPAPTILGQSGGYRPVEVTQLLAGQTNTMVPQSPVFGASYRFVIAGGEHAAQFTINEDTGVLTYNGLAETDAEYTVIVRVIELTRGGYADVEVRAIGIDDEEGGGTGVITTPAAVSVEEGIDGPFVQLTGVGVASWAITGGADASAFVVLNSWGAFVTQPDHGAPHDADEDNVYEVRFTGYDAQGAAIAARDLAVTVLDVTSQPYVLPQQAFTVSAVAPVGTVVGTVQAWVDEGETAQDFTITGGPGAALFAINATTGVITINDDLSSADPNGSIFVTVGDGTNTSGATEITIDISVQSMFAIAPSSITHAPVMELIAAINCGSASPYTHSDGTVYQADAYFTSGATASSANPIAGTVDDTLYQTERWGTTFWYDIPVPAPGLYKLTMHFAETFFTAADAREFTVRLENGNAGDYTTPTIDLWSDAGGKDIAYDIVREIYIDGTSLDMDFVRTVNNASVKGIRLERVSVPALAANEGDSGTTNFAFNIIRTGQTAGASSVQWAVVGTGGNPATASDFVGGVLPSGTASFADGELTKQIIVQVAGDAVSEASETFEVRLSNASAGSTIISGVASATITDDDESGPTFRYFLVDTDTDSVLAELYDGLTIANAVVSGRTCGIYATAANISIGSARLQLDSGTPRTENVAPYSLYGDTGGGTDFLPGLPLSSGSHTLTATWYSGAGATGTVLESASVTFVVAAATGGVTLVNTNSAQAIEMSEAHPPGARLPIVFTIEGVPANVSWSRWTMVSDPDDVFEAINHGVVLKRRLDYSQKTSHTGTVRVEMRDIDTGAAHSTGDFPFTLTVVPFTGTEYYVAPTGNDTNDGTAVSPFLTLAKLASVLEAGDRGWVKAGNYGTQKLSITASGTFAAPIVVEGYQTTPGDDPAYASWTHLTDTPNTALMPCIDKGTRNNDEFGILLAGEHVHVGNFTVSQFSQGVYTTRNWTGAHKVFTREHGRTDVRYSGKGANTGSLAWFVTWKHCYSTNANAQGITVVGDYSAILDCATYCDNNDKYSFSEAGATDYYMIGLGNYATLRRVKTQRAANVTTHGGHGPQCNDGSNGLIENMESINCASGCGFRHAEASYGVMRNFTITGDNGVILRDGVHDCLVEDGVVNDAYFGVWFYESTEAEPGNPGNYSALNNRIRRVSLLDCSYAIATANTKEQAPLTCKGNVLEQMIINGCTYLFLVRHGYEDDNVLKDSTLTDIPNYAFYDSFFSFVPITEADLQVSFSNNTLVNCGFTLS